MEETGENYEAREISALHTEGDRIYPMTIIAGAGKPKGRIWKNAYGRRRKIFTEHDIQMPCSACYTCFENWNTLEL